MPAWRSGAACSIRRPARPRTDAPARARSDRKMTTIFAPSTGAPPAAIAIVRISGPDALAAARTLAGDLPAPREARVRTLRDPATGDHLDRALVLVFPGPSTATGEDLVELHLHGGRAVVAAVEAALAPLPRLRRAEPGEFTRAVLAAPPAERPRDCIRAVLAGPPNSGKSTLLNVLGRREAAIVSPIAGTTRDRIEVTVARSGIPFVLTDTAGLRDAAGDSIEAIGIARAGQAISDADLVLWLGDDSPTESSMLWLHARCDLPHRSQQPAGTIAVSAERPESIEALWEILVNCARQLIPKPNDLALNRRHAGHCAEAVAALADTSAIDELIVADALRRANIALARITGDVGIEAMLDSLFGKFCIGK